MKRSPVQLVDSQLFKLSIEPLRVDGGLTRKPPSPVQDIEFETAQGMQLATDYWEGDVPPGLEGRTFNVHLGIRSLNGTNQPNASYEFEVIFVGIFAIVQEESPSRMPPGLLAWQYGMTMLYGLIRETVASQTLRMPNGRLMLPTMSFLGEGPSETLNEDGFYTKVELQA